LSTKLIDHKNINNKNKLPSERVIKIL